MAEPAREPYFAHLRITAEAHFVGLLALDLQNGGGILSADTVQELRDAHRGHPESAARDWAARHYLGAPCVIQWAQVNLEFWRGNFGEGPRDFICGPMHLTDAQDEVLTAQLYETQIQDYTLLPRSHPHRHRAPVAAMPHRESEGEFIARARQHYHACVAWLEEHGHASVDRPRQHPDTQQHAVWTLRYQVTGSFTEAAPSGVSHSGQNLRHVHTDRVRKAVHRFADLIELPLRTSK